MNKEQIKSLSGFFFDIAKGFVIGMFGLFAVTNVPLELKIISNILGLFFSYICVRVGMQLLDGLQND